MSKSIYFIEIPNLVIAMIPLLFVLVIYYRWFQTGKTVLYATARMLLQLTLIGFVLNFLFSKENMYFNSLLLFFMLLVASWISLYPVREYRKKLYSKVLLALLISGGSVLALVVFFVIKLEPWYQTSYLIPIAGMIFSNTMTSISLVLERFITEKKRGLDFLEARKISFDASMIPIINSFFAVGLVSLPGMMTGQILAGVDPLIAVRYQIMVMVMLFGSSGLASAILLKLFEKDHEFINNN